MKLQTYRSSFFNNQSQRGFTLIELLIVISIIAILTGIIITSLTSSKIKSRDAQRVSDINQIQLALEQYFDRCGQYPAVDGTIGGPDATASCVSGITFGTSYLTKIPKDPSTSVSYGYNVNTDKTDYVLHALLEGTNTQAQQNSYPESVRATNSSWATGFSCYDSTNSASKDYCISTK
ncbi:MAG: type II secretion system protein [Candidatus Pacebacteria bacterium]|nr:type II secretion system protein [Candidatus Paceibacterota bacterium]